MCTQQEQVSANKLTLKDGHKYKTKSGEIITVVRDWDTSTPYIFDTAGCLDGMYYRSYTANGTVFVNEWQTSENDIVEEYKSPALQLEVGKYYANRAGNFCKIVKMLDFDAEWSYYDENKECYRPDGTWSVRKGIESPKDLIEELKGVWFPGLPNPHLKPTDVTILDEAKTIIYGDREETYGHPSKNLNRIADQWSLYLNQKTGGTGVQITAEDVCWMMMDLKKVRQINSKKRDNLVDTAGYLALIERLHEEVNPLTDSTL